MGYTRSSYDFLVLWPYCDLTSPATGLVACARWIAHSCCARRGRRGAGARREPGVDFIGSRDWIQRCLVGLQKLLDDGVLTIQLKKIQYRPHLIDGRLAPTGPKIKPW